MEVDSRSLGSARGSSSVVGSPSKVLSRMSPRASRAPDSSSSPHAVDHEKWWVSRTKKRPGFDARLEASWRGVKDERVLRGRVLA